MPAISQREKEVLEVIKVLGGVARPEKIGEFTGFSQDYVEQICDYLVSKKYMVRQGFNFKLVTDWDGLEEDAKVLREAVRGRFTFGVYGPKGTAPGAVEGRVLHPSSLTRVRTIRDSGPTGDRRILDEHQEQMSEKKAREALEKFTPMALDY